MQHYLVVLRQNLSYPQVESPFYAIFSNVMLKECKACGKYIDI